MNKGYYTCPVCGANLDPGERCEDCQQENRRRQEAVMLFKKLEEKEKRSA